MCRCFYDHCVLVPTEEVGITHSRAGVRDCQEPTDLGVGILVLQIKNESGAELCYLNAGHLTINLCVCGGGGFIGNAVSLIFGSKLVNQKLHFYKISRWFIDTLNFKQLKQNYSTIFMPPVFEI